MSGTLVNLLPFVAMIAIMWFLLIRPAQKRQKATKEMQVNLKRGDSIVTIGGLHGTVDAVDEASVFLKTADGAVMQFDRQAVGRVTDSSTAI